ncbi:right-handed parallel beta-helix repeat-containing protein, partial [Methanobrevibacter sp.]|uniref:DUF11 domain-containing protein n=1 Tax=Methanobrevibacter sp. TaxID=66852 RepID=UPI00388DFB11
MSFASASDQLTNDTNTDALSMMSADDVEIDENFKNGKLNSIDTLSTSLLDQADEKDNNGSVKSLTDEPQLLRANNDGRILSVSNDEQILGAYDISLSGGTMENIRDAILEISANGGGTLYLNGGTYTGASKILAGTFDESQGDNWWDGDSANRPDKVYISNVRIYGGSQIGDNLMANFGDSWDYALTFGVKNSKSPFIPGSGKRGYSSNYGCILNNIIFENLNATTRLVNFQSGSLTDCVINNCVSLNQFMGMEGCYWENTPIPIINCNFTNCHQTNPGAHGVDDGSGQLGAVFGVNMVNCNFINTSSAQHGGALCIADESEWGSSAVSSRLIDCNFINITSRWFAVYLHGNFSSSVAYIKTPELIDGCQFINCTGTGEYSGGIGISHNNAIVRNSKFINNDGGQGGAIMVGGLSGDHDGFSGRNYQGNNVTIENCTFENNIATKEKTSSLCIKLFANLKSGQERTPGVQYYSKIDPNIGDNTIESNFREDDAGTWYVKHETMTFNPTGNAGAIYVYGNDTKILNCTFRNNTAKSGNGAAIYIDGSRTIINDTKFYEHECENGTVYIVGSNTKVFNSTFKDNSAVNGAAVYIKGNNSNINNSTFNKNTVTHQGGAVFIDGKDTSFKNNNFTENEAIPASASAGDDTGLGGAIYVKGDNTVTVNNTFSHNKARNGSAIYTTGKNFNLKDDVFFENQAWSYLLIVNAVPKESLYDQSDVNVTVVHVGGDNIINAIHNEASNTEIHLQNVTFKHSNGKVRNTGAAVLTPVNGAENSQGGTLVYQDDRENLQEISLTIYDPDNAIIYLNQTMITNITGAVNVTLSKSQLRKVGTYRVVATHPEDWNYKEITNTTNFRILGYVDLSVTKTSDKDVYTVGDGVTWIITVTNAYNSTTATFVNVTDVVPSQFEFSNANCTATQGSYSKATNLWEIGTLLPSQVVTLTIKSIAKERGTFDNKANVVSNETDWNETNNEDNKTVNVTAADLEITKTANPDKTRNNSEVIWTITVINKGPDVAYNVRVNGTLDNGLIFSGVPVSMTNPSRFDSNNVWTIDELPVNVPYVLVISTTVNATNATLNNTVEVTSDTYDPNPDNNNATNSTVVPPEADLGIVKEVNASTTHNDTFVEWTIRVTNYGPDNATNVVVTDAVPEELITFDPVGNYKGRLDGNDWIIGEMKVGETQVLVVKTKVNATNTTIVNTVSVVSDIYDPYPENNTASNSTVVPPEADLAINKTVSLSEVRNNTLINWTITVHNYGPDDAVNVVVLDDLPDELILIGAVEGYEGTFDANNHKWIIDLVKNGETYSITLTTRVNATNKTITNFV